MVNLVLISCSDKKKEGGRPNQAGIDPIPWLRDTGLRQRLFETRVKVFDYIRANRLEDSEKRQGKRGIDPRNANLVKGPDFGGDAEGAYLPACVRYDGRFFRTIRGSLSEDETINKWEDIRESYGVLIVSGLYGLVAPFDPIQEYTCHFADRILDTDTSLQLVWRDLLADIIRDQLVGKRGFLVDLLSEEAYQDAFDWASIYKDTKCFHRAFKLKAGPETLVNSALFFSDEFLSQTKEGPAFGPDKFFSKEYFDDPKEEMLFESELKMTKKVVAREGIQEVLSELKKRFGDAWDSLSEKVKKQIANSEYSYVRNRDLRDFDFTAAAICLSKAIEIWLEETIVRPLIAIPTIRPLLVNSKGKSISADYATLGNIACFLTELERRIRVDSWLRNEISNLLPNILPPEIGVLEYDIWDISKNYRNGWAHKKLMPRTLYEEYRLKAIEFFNSWVPKWKRHKGCN